MVYPEVLHVGLRDLFKGKTAVPDAVEESQQVWKPPADVEAGEPIRGHMSIVCDTHEEADALLFKPLKSASQVEKGATLDGANAFGYLLADGPVASVTIVHEIGRVLTAYPMATRGIRHSAVFLGAYACKPAFEGDLEIALGPAQFTVFDPLYFKNHPLYRAGASYTFELAGIGYYLERAREEELHPDGQMRSMKCFAGFRPIEDGGPGEYIYRSPVKAIAQSVSNGRPILRLTLALFRLAEEDGSFRDVDFYLYVRQDRTKGYVPKVGDDVIGAMWLQGYLAG